MNSNSSSNPNSFKIIFKSISWVRFFPSQQKKKSLNQVKARAASRTIEEMIGNKNLTSLPPPSLNPPNEPDEVIKVVVEESKSLAVKPVKQISGKKLLKLKKDLQNPHKAVQIMSELNNLPVHNCCTKGFALSNDPGSDSADKISFTLLSFTEPINNFASSAQAGIIAPLDRASVFIYWWGYEISLPPPSIQYLDHVHSIQSTAFTLLSGLLLAGGAPELAPYLRYISSYVDLEWNAIKAQDQGNGVILAATWIVPVALIPRAWDLVAL